MPLLWIPTYSDELENSWWPCVLVSYSSKELPLLADAGGVEGSDEDSVKATEVTRELREAARSALENLRGKASDDAIAVYLLGCGRFGLVDRANVKSWEDGVKGRFHLGVIATGPLAGEFITNAKFLDRLKSVVDFLRETAPALFGDKKTASAITTATTRAMNGSASSSSAPSARAGQQPPSRGVGGSAAGPNARARGGLPTSSNQNVAQNGPDASSDVATDGNSPVVPPTSSSSTTYHHSSATSMSRHHQQNPDVEREISRLRKELTSIRRKVTARTTRLQQQQPSTSQQSSQSQATTTSSRGGGTTTSSSSVSVNANEGAFLQAALQQKREQLLETAPNPTPAPHVSTALLRACDFLNVFRSELRLGGYPSISPDSLAASLADVDSPLYSAVMSALVSFISLTMTMMISPPPPPPPPPQQQMPPTIAGATSTNPEPYRTMTPPHLLAKRYELGLKWRFSPLSGHRRTLAQMPGTACTILTWECLLESLEEEGMGGLIPHGTAAAASSSRDRLLALDTLVRVASCSPAIKNALLQRLQHAEMMESQLASLRPSPPPTEEGAVRVVRSDDPSAGLSQEPNEVIARKYSSKRLSEAVYQQNHASLEVEIERARDEGLHEGLDEAGRPVWRTAELAEAIAVEEAWLTKRKGSLAIFRLQRGIRAHPVGRDPRGRPLFYFWGDDEECAVRVWCYDSASRGWSHYDGRETVLRLAQLALSLKDEYTNRNLLRVVDSSIRKLRPGNVGAMRAARHEGWRFHFDDLVGKPVRHWDRLEGIADGVVVAWRRAPEAHGETRYRIVFPRGGGDWANAVEVDRATCARWVEGATRLSGDFFASSSLPPGWRSAPEERYAAVQLSTGEVACGVVVGVRGGEDCSSPEQEQGREQSQKEQRAASQEEEEEEEEQEEEEKESALVVLPHSNEVVCLVGRAVVEDATRVVTCAGAPEPSRPLTHRVGPLAGLAGLSERLRSFFPSGIVSLEEARDAILALEQTVGARWPGTLEGGAREAWCAFVRDSSARVCDLALAVECLLDYTSLRADGGVGVAEEQEERTAEVEETTATSTSREENDDRKRMRLIEAEEEEGEAPRNVNSVGGGEENHHPTVST